jgi:thiol-disulfide isomerase/thioredoxin
MLLEFYGKECPHCVRMKPLVEQLEREEGVKFESYEVWHDAANEQKMKHYDKGLCGGVPFFYNTDTGGYVCGETSYEKLKAFALKKAA